MFTQSYYPMLSYIIPMSSNIWDNNVVNWNTWQYVMWS